MKGIGTGGKGGAALITAIIFVFFLTLFGLAFYRLGETDIDLFGYQRNLSRALYASEAGIDKVRWMIRESQQIPGANPFSNAYDQNYVINNIANPTGGNFFPGVADAPYFRASMIQAAGSKVRVRVLGSVDVDGDGVTGLTTTDAYGFTVDPGDVNRRFEAYIGLPGTLGERIGGRGISAAAAAFYAGVMEIVLSAENRVFVTPDGDRIKDRNGNDRFLYFGSGTYGGIWDQWGFIFSDPVKTGDIELPRGIFDTIGDYIDDDTDGIPDYFQDLNPRTYSGDQTFTSSPSDDPTAGTNGRSVIYVNGNITIDRVNFGYLDDQGTEIKFCDWQIRDLAFIANGDITVRRVNCGNVGRLVLVAKNIILEGDYNTKVNGIAIAYNNVTLDGSGCTFGILTHPDTSRPVKYTTYFLGSMVAGNRINLLNDGWTVIYDWNVINGNMYSAAADSVAKPTLTYERVEVENFNTDNNWQSPGRELREWQEDYIQADIDNGQADYTDGGVDETPELMKLVHDQSLIWSVTPPDFAVSDGVYCDFTDAGNVFADSDISIGPQDWDNYTTIHFYMALDNWEKISGLKTTQRISSFQVLLYDTWGNTLTYNLSYQSNDWIADPGKVGWKLVRINPYPINNPLLNFDSRSVDRIEFYYDDILVSWYINDSNSEQIRYDKNSSTGYGSDGYYYYMKFNPTGPPIKYPIQFEPPDANGRRQLYYEDPPGTVNYIQWNWDPSTSTLENMYFEDTLNPLKSALNSFLKIDRIELPGKPDTNNFLEYGLPYSLRLDVTNWHEL